MILIFTPAMLSLALAVVLGISNLNPFGRR